MELVKFAEDSVLKHFIWFVREYFFSNVRSHIQRLKPHHFWFISNFHGVARWSGKVFAQDFKIKDSTEHESHIIRKTLEQL